MKTKNKTITEDYVSFLTAKLLKEKGFDGTCRAFWKDWNGQTMLCHCSRSHVFDWCHNSMLEKYYNDNEETNIAAPTLQMAMKWLREVHKLHILCYMKWKTWKFEIEEIQNCESDYDKNGFASYEEAVETAIKYCLTNLIK